MAGRSEEEKREKEDVDACIDIVGVDVTRTEKSLFRVIGACGSSGSG